MQRTLFVTIILSILALAAPFMFPWPYTIVLSVLASFFVPPIAAIVGLLLDLSYMDHFSIPYFTMLGCAIALCGAFVHQFMKTRIMS